MSRDILVVTGETGVGKDYLVDRANVGPDAINRANWGDVFSSIAEEDKDRLSHELYVPGADETEAIQRQVCQTVIDLQPVVVTSHPVKVINGIEYVNWDIEQRLSPRSYFVVEADPEVIRDRVIRRNASGERKSRVLSTQELADTQGRRRELTGQLASHVGANLIVLCNDECRTLESVELLRDAIKNLRIEGSFSE